MDGICVLFTTCFSVNVMAFINCAPRRRRIRGHCHYALPIPQDLPFILKPFALHYPLSKQRRVPLVEQVLLTLPEHLSSLPVLVGVRVTRSLVLYVCFVDRCLSFCTFLLAIVLSVLFRYTDSDYPFGIFMLFLYNSCVENLVTDPNSNQYKATAIMLNIALHRLFRSVGIWKDEKGTRSFLKLPFTNKGFDAI